VATSDIVVNLVARNEKFRKGVEEAARQANGMAAEIQRQVDRIQAILEKIPPAVAAVAVRAARETVRAQEKAQVELLKAQKEGQKELIRLEQDRAKAKVRALQEAERAEAKAHAEAIKRMAEQQKAADKASTALAEHHQKVEGYVNTVKQYAIDMAKAFLSLSGVQRFSDFNKAMTEATSVMDDMTPELTKQLEDLAKTLSMKTRFSATEVSQAFYHLATAGFTVTDILKIMPRVAEFATAGNFDLQKATDLLGTSMAVMGVRTGDASQNLVEAHKITEALVRVANKAQGSVSDFAHALARDAGAIARQFNIPLEDVVATLGAYHEQGLKGAIAGNTFGRMIRLLTDSFRRHKDVWEELKLNIFETTGPNKGAFRPIEQIIKDLENAVSKYHAQGKGDLLSALGMKTLQQKSTTPLLGMSASIEKFKALQAEVGDVAQEVAEKQMTAFANAIQVVKNSVEVARIELEEMLAPAFMKVGQVVRQVTDYWRALNPETQRTVLAITGLTIGLMALAPALSMILPVVKALALSTAPFLALSVALVTLSQTDLSDLKKAFDEVQEAAKVLWEAFKDIAGVLLRIVVPAIQTLLTEVAAIIKAVATFIKENQQLVEDLLILVAAFYSVKFAIAAYAFVVGIASKASIALAASFWRLTAAMLANPLTAAATAAAIAAAFIIMKLVQAKKAADELRESLANVASVGLENGLKKIEQDIENSGARLASNLGKLGGKMGKDFSTPIEKALEKIDAALRRSVEGLSRIEKYRDMVLNFNKRSYSTGAQEAAFPNLYEDTTAGNSGAGGAPRMPGRVPPKVPNVAANQGSQGGGISVLAERLAEVLPSMIRERIRQGQRFPLVQPEGELDKVAARNTRASKAAFPDDEAQQKAFFKKLMDDFLQMYGVKMDDILLKLQQTFKIGRL
jgi:TP901 family phage tail tape measure protein